MATQRERVLEQLRKRRETGLNTVDFQRPTCDGGPPILRVAARILELQDAGFGIASRRQMNGTATYTLMRDVGGDISDRHPDDQPPAVGSSPDPDVSSNVPLFDLPAPRRVASAIGGDWEAA